MIKNIDKLFSYFPKTKYISISSCDSGSGIREFYHYNYIYDDSSSDCRAWGYTTIDYNKIHNDEPEYRCDRVVENNTEFSEDTVKDILRLTQVILHNTDTVNGYNIKITKERNDYLLEIPELTHKYYRASEYPYFNKYNNYNEED